MFGQVNVHNDLLEEYILPCRLTGHTYSIFQHEALHELLIDVLTTIYRLMYFQHDWVPAHFPRKVRNHLLFTANNGTGREGPTVCPPRFTDLIFLDISLTGHIKSLICNSLSDL